LDFAKTHQRSRITTAQTMSFDLVIQPHADADCMALVSARKK
jgi:hypothetical protein